MYASYLILLNSVYFTLKVPLTQDLFIEQFKFLLLLADGG